MGGWGDCGEDSLGRPIGYYFEGTCDHPGCNAVIDRGLAYSCGGMHGQDEFSCEEYFCYKHKVVVELKSDCTRDGDCISVCSRCYTTLEKNKMIVDDDEEEADDQSTE